MLKLIYISSAGAGTSQTDSDTVIIVSEEPWSVWGSSSNANTPQNRREGKDGRWVFWLIVWGWGSSKLGIVLHHIFVTQDKASWLLPEMSLSS